MSESITSTWAYDIRDGYIIDHKGTQLRKATDAELWFYHRARDLQRHTDRICREREYHKNHQNRLKSERMKREFRELHGCDHTANPAS